MTERQLDAADPVAQAVVGAIQAGDVTALQALLTADPALVHVRIVDKNGASTRSLLHIATDWPGHFPNGPETVAALARAGADLNARTSPHPTDPNCLETPLHWAASSNDTAVLTALLDHGADIEATGAVFTGGTAMSDAVIFANWDAARLLLARGATTTLSQAAALGLLDRVRELCEVQRAPSVDEFTRCLWHACRAGQRSTAEYLLGLGADRNWLGWDGMTPITAAEHCGHADLAAWLRTVPPRG
jgi:uncharacterized protein